ncbi:MAG: hypothetical protein MPW15_22105 [Candidatus Manganitrophus sp.]|nr:hypothetical protein [Candidatus Manganitrophus sp.]
MLSGINTDIQFKGEVYHVQTEDGGIDNPIVTTLLFKGGAIFSSKKTNYAEILQSPSYQQVVRELMKEQHKNMVRDLTAGKFDTGFDGEKGTARRSTGTAGKNTVSDARCAAKGKPKKKLGRFNTRLSF